MKQMTTGKHPTPAINLASQPIIPAYDITQDEDMMGVLKSFSSHLTTVNSNLHEMKDVRAWINRAEESMGEVLRRLGGREELDRIYGAEVM